MASGENACRVIWSRGKSRGELGEWDVLRFVFDVCCSYVSICYMLIRSVNMHGIYYESVCNMFDVNIYE